MVRGILVLCLLGATFNHVKDLWLGSWLPYGDSPLWRNVFWTSLTFLDPLAVLLLLTRPRMGYVLTLVIMLVDVPVNTAALDKLSSKEQVHVLQAQTLFLGFVLGVAPLFLKGNIVKARE